MTPTTRYRSLSSRRLLARQAGPLPQPVANDSFQIKTGRMVLGIKRAAQLRCYAQQRKIVRRFAKKEGSRRLRRAREIHGPATAQWRNVFKNPGTLEIVPLRY